MSKVYIISDTHLKHEAMRTYCDRPADFTETINWNINTTVKSDDFLIHVGDVGIGKAEDWDYMVRKWPGKKTLIRGNHDTNRSPTWWLNHGFDGVCDGMIFRGVWVTHRPALSLPDGCNLNLHGHLHNIWHGFHPDEETAVYPKRLKFSWQRLFAVEYTNYMPVEWEKFFAQPQRYQAMGPQKRLDND